MTAPETASDITPRAFVVGALLAGLIGLGTPYAALVIQGTDMALTCNTPAAFFLFLVWIAVVQLLLGLLSRRLPLRRGELVVVYVMMLVATAVPTRGFTGMLFATISGPLYYATPENNWGELILPYIPRWMMPQDWEAVRAFYEGLPAGQAPPWHAWLASIGWWLLLIGAFYLATICTMVIVRRQWVEHERLVYPMIQVPLAMLPGREGEGGSPVLFRRGLLWTGLLLSFAINSANVLHTHNPAFPAVPLQANLPLLGSQASLGLRLSLLMLGFSYLIQSSVMLGLWVFYLLRVAEVGVLQTLGVTMHERLAPFSGWGGVSGILGYQTTGATVVFVFAFLWSARSHLRRVWHGALGRASQPEEHAEVLSFRLALLGLVAGLAVMAGWLWRAGLPLWAVPLFLGAAFLVFLALTRIIVETGLPTVTPRLIPCDLLVSGVGSSALGARGMIAMASSFVWAGDLLIFLMAPVAHALKLGAEVRGRRQGLFWAMVLALAVSLAVSIVTFMVLSYAHGAANLYAQYFSSFPQYPFDYAADLISTPRGASTTGWILVGVGAALMGLLTLVHRRFLWWPVHPIGFVVSADWVMDNTWFSIFLAWLIKTRVLRYGGPALYRSTLPLFYGFILGQFAAAGVWLCADGLRGVQGGWVPVF